VTIQELESEFNYHYEERLGILCEDRELTPEQIAIASREAGIAIADLQAQDAALNEIHHRRPD
jgi:hypothetical protein